MSCLFLHHFLLAFLLRHFLLQAIHFHCGMSTAILWMNIFFLVAFPGDRLHQKCRSWPCLELPSKQRLGHGRPSSSPAWVNAHAHAHPLPRPLRPLPPLLGLRFQLFVTRFNEACQFSMKCFGILCCVPFFSRLWFGFFFLFPCCPNLLHVLSGLYDICAIIGVSLFFLCQP